MNTVFATNNGFDTVLLVDDNDTVISAWPVTKKVLSDYLNDTDPDDWESQFLEEEISDYGEEAGRNGRLSQERSDFYHV